MKNFIYCLSFCFFAFSLQAEIGVDTVENPKKVSYHVGITPSALFNVYSGIQFSQDIYFNEYIGFGCETAYIFAQSKKRQTSNERGFRLRPAIKLKPFGNIPEISIFYNYRYLRATNTVKLIRANGAFFEYVSGDWENTLEGWGLGCSFGSSNPSLPIKIGFGIGTGTVRNHYSDPALNSNNFLDFLFFTKEGVNVAMIFFLHFNVQFF